MLTLFQRVHEGFLSPDGAAVELHGGKSLFAAYYESTNQQRCSEKPRKQHFNQRKNQSPDYVGGTLCLHFLKPRELFWVQQSLEFCGW